ncbi:gliding motility-associated C-terminal domain-containing protein, partial [Reichenbachiella agariperforans]
PATLTFTATSWNTAQTVTITGVDDNIIDGTQTYNVTIAVVDASSDDNFDPLASQTVAVENADDDSPGFEVSETTASTSESGTTDDFTVKLMSEPDTDVVISITSGDTGEGTVAPATLTFTPANWNVAQTVTITGVADNIIDGVITYDATIAIIDALSDDNFDGWADITISVSNTDTDTAPTANNNSNTTDEDITLTIAQASGLLNNASDADGDVVSIESFEVESITYNPSETANLSVGSVTIHADGSYVFVPATNYNGIVPIISYSVTDGVNTDDATLSLSVLAVNDLPVAIADIIAVNEGATATVLTSGANSVLANDTDVEGNALTAKLATDVSHGTLTLNSDGTFQYIHDGSETTTDSFAYKANDGTSDGNTITVTITITPVNDAPVFTSTPITTVDANTLYSYTITTSDNDGDLVSITAAVIPTWLNITDHGNGTATLSGTPDNGDTGDYNFSLNATDGTVNIQQIFTITVNSKFRPPTDIYLSDTTIMENAVSGTEIGLLNSEDLDINETFTYSLLGTNASLFSITGDVLSSNMVFNFENISSYDLIIRSTDSNGASYDKTFTIYVTDENDPPTHLHLDYNRVIELSPIETVIGELTTVDEDIIDNHIYTIVDGDYSDLFLLSGQTLYTNEVFYMSDQSSYEISIQSVDKGGATIIQDFVISIEQNEKSRLIIPTAFTPNGDNENDTWEILNLNLSDDNKVVIFDRSGRLIFESRGYKTPWSGKYRGDRLPTGTYFYQIEVIIDNKAKTYKGFVTIL